MTAWWHHKANTRGRRGLKYEKLKNEYAEKRKKERKKNSQPIRTQTGNKKRQEKKKKKQTGNFFSHKARRWRQWQQFIRIVPWLVGSRDSRAEQGRDTTADVMLLWPITFTSCVSVIIIIIIWATPSGGGALPLVGFWTFIVKKVLKSRS